MALTNFLTIAFTLANKVSAARPEDVSICYYYTPLVTGKENSAASQQELMTIAVNTLIVGNYTKPNIGIKVDGIAAPSNYQGQDVNLLPYFTSGYASTNLGGDAGEVKNFLDDGGAVPLTMSKPANGTDSNQFDLLTHLYQYFGMFFGCTMQGQGDEFPNYRGEASMYKVHKYMDIDKYEMGFFNKQVIDAVTSLGFEDPDVKFTNDTFFAAFSNRCTPAAAVIPPDQIVLQSICVAPNCPLDIDATCGAYPNGGPVEQPKVANETLIGDVMKPNETEAAPSAVWCKSDGDCATVSASQSAAAESSASASAAEGFATETGAATAVALGRPAMLAVVGVLAWTFFVAGAGAMTRFVL